MLPTPPRQPHITSLPVHPPPTQAATFAFGSILEGPSVETLAQLVQSGLGFLLTALKQDPNAHVKDTTAWTIGAPQRWAGGAGRQGGAAAGPREGHPNPSHPLTPPTHPTGRIFEFAHGVDAAAPLLGPQNLPQVVEALLHAIRDAPHIAEKVRAPLL